MTTVALTTQQDAALARFADLKVGAVFMEQGMGKSRVAVELANDRAGSLDFVLWVAPFSVLATVEAEVIKWGLTVPVRFLGYETLSQSDVTYLEVLAWCAGKRLLVIADESTFIKNAWAKRHIRMMEIRKLATYAICLNGTPLTRDPWDLKRQMDWLSPRILGMSDKAFRTTYFQMRDRGKGTEKHVWWEAYEPNMAHLRSLMEPYVHEARLYLGIEEITLAVEHNRGSDAQDAYVTARDDFFEAWEAWGEKVALYRLLGQLARIAGTDPVKCREVADAVAGRHTVVFCQYREEQALIARHLGKAFLMINGDTTPVDREVLFERFKIERVPLLLTYGTGSFGLNLQHVNEMHFSSLGFDYGRMQQAKSRIRRLGQERAITYTTHTSGFGIDAMIGKNLLKKTWLAELVRHEFDPRTIL